MNQLDLHAVALMRPIVVNGSWEQAAVPILICGLAVCLLILIQQQYVALRRLNKTREHNSRLMTANARLEAIATTDPLTNLPNRTALYERGAAIIETAGEEGAPVSLLLLDLDRFKEVNDTLGHHCGDVLLQQVAITLQFAVRHTDIVVRLGGDEFVVLLPATAPTQAIDVCKHILAALDRPFMVEAQTLSVRASIGVASCPADGNDISTLLRYADVAMYEAKRQHCGYIHYDAQRDGYSLAQLALASDLQQAIATGMLHLDYQPLIDIASNRVIGAEALLRWKHPVHGIIGPDQFVPLAETTGQIDALTAWVLNEALRQSGIWRDAGLSLIVHVNISASNLHSLEFVDGVVSALARHDIKAELLMLEITENAIMQDPVRALSVLERLEQLGLRTAIDDFGMGYSSLGYLKHLPVHEVKIDKSFTMGMCDDSRDLAIVCSIVGLGHALGLQVVAEGVETNQALNLLATIDCDIAQGYLHSRPLDAADIVPWITAGLHGGIGNDSERPSLQALRFPSTTYDGETSTDIAKWA